jgi:hypothetical protein
MLAHQQKYWSSSGWDGPKKKKKSLGQQAIDNTYHAFNQYKNIVIATLKISRF